MLLIPSPFHEKNFYQVGKYARFYYLSLNVEVVPANVNPRNVFPKLVRSEATIPLFYHQSAKSQHYFLFLPFFKIKTVRKVEKNGVAVIQNCLVLCCTDNVENTFNHVEVHKLLDEVLTIPHATPRDIKSLIHDSQAAALHEICQEGNQPHLLHSAQRGGRIKKKRDSFKCLVPQLRVAALLHQVNQERNNLIKLIRQLSSLEKLLNTK